MLKHPDSPYIRAVGFLYLRFVCEPKQLWSWLQPYVTDQAHVTVEQKGGAPM
jgi:pre-mRNA-splicing factor 38B